MFTDGGIGRRVEHVLVVHPQFPSRVDHHLHRLIVDTDRPDQRRVEGQRALDGADQTESHLPHIVEGI